MVVILILAILAAMVVPRIVSRTEDAKVTRASSDLVNIRKMLEQFRLDVGRYPTNDEALDALEVAPSDVSGWKGPYATKPIGVDPWGNAYYFENNDDDTYLLMSFGSDGSEGGDGYAADIVESE